MRIDFLIPILTQGFWLELSCLLVSFLEGAYLSRRLVIISKKESKEMSGFFEPRSKTCSQSVDKKSRVKFN